MKDIQSQREILKNLQREGASALLLSGGGNDVFDDGNMGKLVEEPFPGATPADLVGPTYRAFIREVLGRHLEVFIRIHTALPHVHILTHAYSNAFPSGDRWIEQPLTKRGVPKEIQHDVVKLMLGEFSAGLVQLSKRAEFHGMIEVIDLTSIGTKRSEWHNEIHLNGAAAAKAAEKFRKVLKRRLGGVAPEVGQISPRQSPIATTVVHQAESLSALDDNTLLQELDLRVSLLEMDPSAAQDPLPRSLALESAAPEVGLASLREQTRKLLNTWERNLRELLCSGRVETDLDKAILQAVEKGKTALAGAIASWLITGPFAVPVAAAGALAAFLAGKVIDMGLAHICARWTPSEPETPALAGGAAPEGSMMTFGSLRAHLTTAGGADGFSKSAQKDRLKSIEDIVVKMVVENPRIPVDADAAKSFIGDAQDILERLGAEKDDAEVPVGHRVTAEAIVAVDGSRPSVYVQDGFVDLKNPLLVKSNWHTTIAQYEDDIRKFINASGRIIQVSDRSANFVYGSAWMLEGGRVATARHVIENMTHPQNGELLLKDRFYIDFSVEADRPMDPSKVFRISGVDWAGPEKTYFQVNFNRLDAAVLTLEPSVGRDFPDPIPLLGADKSIGSDDWFINVGHPAKPKLDWWLVEKDDGKKNSITRAVLEALIGNKFGVKRLSPGVVQFAPGVLPADMATQHVFSHDSSTLAGSSGSGILSLSPAAMSGLHFAGKFGTANYAHFIPAIRSRWQS